MAENLDKAFETQPTSSGSSGQPQFNSPKLTLSVLRFVANASLIIGFLVGIGALIFFLVVASNPKASPAPILFVAIGALAQGFIIFALFNALALIVENLIGIRENLNRTGNKV
jgi:hypothetical protein